MCIVIYYLYIYTYIVHILYIYIQCIYIVISTLYIYIYMYCTYLIYIHCIYIVYIHCIYTHIHCMYTLHVYIYTHCIYRPLDCTYTYIHIYCVYREREIFALHIYTNNLLLPTISMFVYTHLCYIVKSAWKKKKSYIYIYTWKLWKRRPSGGTPHQKRSSTTLKTPSNLGGWEPRHSDTAIKVASVTSYPPSCMAGKHAVCVAVEGFTKGRSKRSTTAWDTQSWWWSDP